MKIGYSYGTASGFSKEQVQALGFRFEKEHGFSPDAGESYVVQAVGDQEVTRRGIAGWFTGIWQSEAQKVYVTEADYKIHYNPDPDPRADAAWQVFELPCILRGVWGLDDDFVLAWGAKGDRQYLFRWDGKRWSEMDPPPGYTLGVHGLSRDLIYAVGQNGLIARWDGQRWSKVQSPTDTTLSSVFVVSEDEMYACGNGRRLLEGSIHGWSEVLDAPMQLLSVVKWKGDVWVAAPDTGLLKLVDNKLEVVKDTFKPSRLDARGKLLCSAANMIVDSDDGKKFHAFFLDAFTRSVKGDFPMWLSDDYRDEFEEEG
jgi:hypothetical protein